MAKKVPKWGATLLGTGKCYRNASSNWPIWPEKIPVKTGKFKFQNSKTKFSDFYWGQFRDFELNEISKICLSLDKNSKFQICPKNVCKNNAVDILLWRIFDSASENYGYLVFFIYLSVIYTEIIFLFFWTISEISIRFFDKNDRHSNNADSDENTKWTKR